MALALTGFQVPESKCTLHLPRNEPCLDWRHTRQATFYDRAARCHPKFHALERKTCGSRARAAADDRDMTEIDRAVASRDRSNLRDHVAADGANSA